MTRESKRASRARKVSDVSADAIKVAVAWDSLPLVAQNHVREVINALTRLRQDDSSVARLLWARSDPKRVQTIERKIERYQANYRKGKSS